MPRKKFRIMRPNHPSIKAKERQEAQKILEAANRCRQKYASMNTRYRRRLTRWLGEAYGIAYRLLRDSRAWAEFTKSDVWKHRRRKPKSNVKYLDKALIWTFRYLLSDGKDDQYDLAYTYAVGLQSFFDKGVKPEEIPGLIDKHGGIRALYKAAAEENKQRRAKASRQTWDDFRKLLDEDGRSEQGDVPKSNEAPAGSSKSKTAKRKDPDPSLPIRPAAQETLAALDKLYDAVVLYIHEHGWAEARKQPNQP